MRDWPETVKHLYDRAVLIDRDGVINVDTHYPHDPKELILVDEAFVGIRRLAFLPLHVIVVSNQGGIAQGRYTVEQMSEFNEAIRSGIQNEGGLINAFYYCPHEEEKNLPDGVEPCECSKPRPGMLLEAAKDFGFDLSKSFMIGDRLSDMKAGRAVKCTTIKVDSANIGQDAGDTVLDASLVAPFIDFYAMALDDAADIIAGAL
jgi:D-glycero-D-manno-heptose 1,7-bisphosphate phosphatase